MGRGGGPQGVNRGKGRAGEGVGERARGGRDRGRWGGCARGG